MPSETNEGSPSNRPNGTNSGKYAWGHATSGHESKRSVTSKSVDAEQIDIRRSTEHWAESRILNADPASFLQFIKVEKQEKPVTDATPKAKLEKEKSEFDKWFEKWKPGDSIPATKPGTRLVISSDFTGKLSGKKITPKPKFKLNDKPVEVKGILGESLGENKKYLNLLLRVARSRGIPFDEEGRLRCPEDTPGGGQFTDLQMSNCMIPSGGAVAESIGADRILGVRNRALSWLEQITDSLNDGNNVIDEEINEQSLLAELTSDLQNRENRINAGMSIDAEPDSPDGLDNPPVGGRVEENGKRVIGFREMLMRKAFMSLAMKKRNKTLDNALKQKYGITLKGDDDYKNAIRKIFSNLDQESIESLFDFPDGSFVNATAEANFKRHHQQMLRSMMLEAIDNPEVTRRLSRIDIVDSASDLNLDNNGDPHEDIAQANLDNGVFSIAIFPHNYEGFLQQLGDKNMQTHMAFGSSTDPDVVGHYVGVHEFGHLADFYYKSKKLGISEDGSLIQGSEIWNKYNDALSDNDPNVRKQAFEDMWNEVSDYLQGYNGDMDLEQSLMPLVGSSYGYSNTIEAAAEFYAAYRLLRPFLTQYNKANPNSVDADKAFKEMFETTSKVGGEALPAVRKLSLIQANAQSAVGNAIRRGSGRNRRLRTTGQGLFRSRPRRNNAQTFKPAVANYVSNVVPSSSNNATFWAASNNQRLEKRGWLLPIYALDNNSAKVLSDSAEKALRDIEDRWRKEIGLAATEPLEVDDMIQHLNTLEGAKHGVFRTYLHNLVTLDEMLRTGDMSLINDVKIKQRHAIFEDMGLSFGGSYRGTSGSASPAMPFNMRPGTSTNPQRVSGSMTAGNVQKVGNVSSSPVSTVLGKRSVNEYGSLEQKDTIVPVYDVDGEMLAFGSDATDDPNVKILPVNPYVISNTDPTSEDGQKYALLWFDATVGQMDEDSSDEGRTSALLYSAARGDKDALKELERLAEVGRKRMKQTVDENLQQRDSFKKTTYKERDLDWYRQKAPQAVIQQPSATDRYEREEPRLIDLDKDVYMVHQTSYMPSVDPSTGDFIIKPAEDHDVIDPSTGKKWIDPVTGEAAEVYRGSVHFSLNHIVEGHMYRPTPTNKTYVVVIPAKSMLDSNPGALDNLYAIDSWMTPKPGEGLRIPKDKVKIIELPAISDFDIEVPQGSSFDWTPEEQARYSEAIKLVENETNKRFEAALDEVSRQHTQNPFYTPRRFPPGMHGSDENIDLRIRDIATSLGVGSSKHDGSAAAMIEGISSIRFPNVSGAFKETGAYALGELSENAKLRIANNSRFATSAIDRSRRNDDEFGIGDF